MLAILVKIVIVLIVVPVLTALYVARARKGTKSAFMNWAFMNPYFYYLVAVVFILFVFDLMGLRADSEPSPEDIPLTYLSSPHYEGELDSLDYRDADWQIQKNELIRKFEHATFAYGAGGYQEALQSLLSLESGKDNVGSLRKITSFAVANNLGCVYFKIQRNREFRASGYFSVAKMRATPSHPDWQFIEQNLHNLNRMVNVLD